MPRSGLHPLIMIMIMEGGDHFLYEPILSFAATSRDDNVSEEDDHFLSNFSIAVRFLCVLLIIVVSVLANHEASKGFNVVIINDAKKSPIGQRFALAYVSDDKATRIVLNASRFIENFLYPNDSFQKKLVNSVTLRLDRKNLAKPVIVDEFSEQHAFVIHMSPLVLQEIDVDSAIMAAVQLGMARVWLWDGESMAPPLLMAGLVEHICTSAGYREVELFGPSELPECKHRWWEDVNPKVVSYCLNYCETRHKGFIQRLNQRMKTRWDDRMEDALGIQLGIYAI